MNYDRSQWIRALMAVPSDELKALIANVCVDYSVKNTAIPQSGIGIVRMLDSALGEHFYLGEIPVATARVALSIGDGNQYEGAAKAMCDSKEIALALAISDAILANKLPGYEKFIALVERGIEETRATEKRRNYLLSSTRVDFSDFSYASGLDQDE